MKNWIALFTLVTALSSTANALPLGHWDASHNTLRPLVASRLAGAVDFSAIVALDDCSGFLVRFEKSLESDPAMVMTNGHCYEGGFLDPGQVLYNQPSDRVFHLLAPNGDNLAKLQATKILYATMTFTDITLYQLGESFADIEQKFHTVPLILSSQHPQAGSPIAVASGYWKKIYACNIDKFIYELHEGNWMWKDSIRYSQPGCETIGGTSGSPVIDPETHAVVGINNTGNENGERCTVDNPCEVDPNGNIVVAEGASYGEETYVIYSCLNNQSQIDLTLPSCLLPKPQSVAGPASREFRR
jgi:V8-like Glu-specific endopeptidase